MSSDSNTCQKILFKAKKGQESEEQHARSKEPTSSSSCRQQASVRPPSALLLVKGLSLLHYF